MSDAKTPDGGAKKSGDSSQSGTSKKNKSKGFIEASGYKPGWLETGPLPADLFPESPAPLDDSSIAEEFAALQEALQKYYGAEATEDTPDSQPPQEDTPLTTEPLDTAPPTPEEPPEWIRRAIASATAEPLPIELPPATPIDEPLSLIHI